MPPSSGVSGEWLQQNVAAATFETAAKVWRAVEAQHVVSTLRLTGNDPDQQDLLELILEETKPPQPSETGGLHYLLATPFRYPPLPYGSRFRAWPDPGVLYAAKERRTACAEMGYWRWRFVDESEGLLEIAAAPQTLFQCGVRGAAVNLQAPPLNEHARFWTDPVDYSQTQLLGRSARAARVALVLYESVRDPEAGTCVAVLHPGAFQPKRLLAQETWYLTVTSDSAIWQREGQRFAFPFG